MRLLTNILKVLAAIEERDKLINNMVKSVEDYLFSTNEWIQEIRKFTVKWNQKKLEKLQLKSVNEIESVFEDVKDWIRKVKTF